MSDPSDKIQRPVDAVAGVPIAPSLEAALIAADVPAHSTLIDLRAVYITVLAIVVGALGGLIAQALIWLIRLLTNISFHGQFSGSPEIVIPGLNYPLVHPHAWVILIPVAGAIIIGLMARFGSRAVAGHGIPEAMEQVLTNESRIPPRLTFLKPVSAAISIGTGAPYGAEGPIIATGGAIGSLLGQLLSTTATERKVLLAAGASAGICAAFNCPIAAVLLAVELLLFEFRPRSLIPVAAASIVASGLHIFFEGKQPFFTFGSNSITVPTQQAVLLYLLIGCIVGLGSIVLTRAVILIEHLFEHLPIHWMWHPAIGAVFVGVIGYYVPETFGSGYYNIDHLLADHLTLSAIAILGIMKFLSWTISLGSGTAGGTLAPVFTIGGALGAASGLACLHLFPHSGINIGMAALVGMVGIFAGASRAFLTSVVFAIETTMQPAVIVPVLGGCTMAYLISCLLMRHSIMTEKMVRHGVHVPEEYHPDFLETIPVKEMMTKKVVTVRDNESVESLRRIFSTDTNISHQGYPVVDAAGHLRGVVTRRDVLGESKPTTTAEELLKRPPVVIYEDLSLRDAARQMAHHDIGRLPVIRRLDSQLVGILTRSDILNAHRRRIQEPSRSIRIFRRDSKTDPQRAYAIADGTGCDDRKIVKWPLGTDFSCGRNSVVECSLPKADVVGSNPIARLFGFWGGTFSVDMGDSWHVHLVRAEQSDWPDGRVIFRPPGMASGWMRLRFHVLGKTPFKAMLNFATERGFTSERIITLEFSNGEAEQIVYFPQTIEQFSLDISAATDDLKSLDVSATPLSRLAITWAALRRNLGLAMGGKARRRPSILIGLKLLATGQFSRFFRQLRVNANPESVEEKQYENWMRRHERIEERIHQFLGQSSAENGPVFSIFLPVHEHCESSSAEILNGTREPNCSMGVSPMGHGRDARATREVFSRASESHIRRTVESVLHQAYAKWELWIPASAPHVQDARIKTPTGIVGANTDTDFLNAALLSATGEFVVLLQPGDQLAPHALHAVAEMLQKQPTADLLYSDEDTMDETGVRSDAFFKPGWSPEYLLASMYIGQAAIYRTALVKKIGGFRVEHAAARDYDMALRISERTSSIIHVPEILYHRHPGYRRDAGADVRAVEASLQSRNMPATVHPSPRGDFHLVRYPVVGRPLVSILMASACKPVHIPRTGASATPIAAQYWALNSLFHLRQKATYDRMELILLTPPRIDGELAKALDALDVIRCVYAEPFNFSSATNQAAAMSHGEHLLLLNDDTELISPDFIERMLSFSQQNQIGAVGAKLLYSDGTIQHAGIVMPGCSPGHPFHDKPRNSSGYHHSAQLHRNYLAVTAACMMTRRSVFNELRGFDESFHMNYNDVDYCLRAVQKGYRVVYQPEAELYHHESMSKPPIQRSELRKFQARWANVYPLDPFYHREFRAEDCSFVLRS